MKTPKGLIPLIEDGIISGVVRQLQSGKEAAVFVVTDGAEQYCAKVYKDAQHRSFQKVAQYREGRKTRGSRDARAAGRRTRQGVKFSEAQWKSSEVAALYRLVEAGVRVPKPLGVHDGVLLMELVRDEHGQPAPRLNEVDFTPEQARNWHSFLIGQIVRMLCAGLVHGDLSEFNVLIGPDGPVIIDLPQAVDAANNNNAFEMLARDVNNMRATFSRAAPELAKTQYAIEMWDLYQSAALQPTTVLSGRHSRVDVDADVTAVLDQIEEARAEAVARQLGRDAAESA